MAATRVFMLMLFVHFATAKYVQYEVYSNKDCTEASLDSLGIFAGDGECLPSHPDISNFRSRKVTCSGITNFPISTACENLLPNELFPDAKITTTELGKCHPITGTEGKFIKYSCQLGGYYRSFVSNSPFAVCDTVETDSESAVSDEFFFDDRCTNGFDEVLLSPLVRSDLMVRLNTTAVERRRWDNKLDCTGTPDVVTVHQIDECVVDPTDNEGVSLVRLTSGATTTGYASLVVFNLMAILALFA